MEQIKTIACIKIINEHNGIMNAKKGRKIWHHFSYQITEKDGSVWVMTRLWRNLKSFGRGWKDFYNLPSVDVVRHYAQKSELQERTKQAAGLYYRPQVVTKICILKAPLLTTSQIVNELKLLQTAVSNVNQLAMSISKKQGTNYQSFKLQCETLEKKFNQKDVDIKVLKGDVEKLLIFFKSIL